MDVKIKTTKSYTIQIGDKIHTGFVEESRWEGFIKLKNPEGLDVIVSYSPGVKQIFDELFGDDEFVDTKIIKASPELVK